MIQSFSEQYEMLSNFAQTPVSIAIEPGVIKQVPTVEHAFQAYKTLVPEERLAIAAATTPGQAKRMGKNVTLRWNWELIKEQVMLDLLMQKFTTNPEAMKVLLDTGDEELVEGNYWHDQFWGQCFCKEHLGTGKNTLGHLLMVVRSRLRTLCME
jgi:conserved hypothetical protein, ribA/ribD-fused